VRTHSRIARWLSRGGIVTVFCAERENYRIKMAAFCPERNSVFETRTCYSVTARFTNTYRSQYEAITVVNSPYHYLSLNDGIDQVRISRPIGSKTPSMFARDPLLGPSP
jgi:hypothetical protein